LDYREIIFERRKPLESREGENLSKRRKTEERERGLSL